MSFRARLSAAWQAFRHYSPVYADGPKFAVIYDSHEAALRRGEPDADPVEEYYEAFSDPGEAYVMFRTAYPANLGLVEPGSERLVMILGPIDEHKPDEAELDEIISGQYPL